MLMDTDQPDDSPAQERRRATTGFPSPVEDYYQECPLDLNQLLIDNPTATYFMLVQGDGLRHRGVCEGDIVIIDRAAPLRRENIAVVTWEGELVLRIVHWDGKRLRVSPGTEAQVVAPGNAFQLWGTVTYVLHPITRPFPHHFWKATQT